MSSLDVSIQPTARQIIESGGIVTYFQPILSARQRSVIGAEALSRGIVGVEALSHGSANSPIMPAQLFRMAEREGVSLDMERLCRATAIKTFASLERPQDLLLFLNFDASALARDSSLLSDLLSHLHSQNLSPRNVAIEFLESAFDDAPGLEPLLEQFRAYGFLLVLDDVGTGHSNLDRIPLIKPDVMKLDRSLLTGIETDYYRQETLKSLVSLARRIGALVVCEGIETQEQATIALELGADLLQGYFLGRPERAGSLMCEDATARIESLARSYKSYMIQRINQRKLQHRRFNIIINEILCDLSEHSSEQFDAELVKMLPKYPGVECVYILDEAGVQISSTIFNPTAPRRGKGVIFRPAPKGADHSLKEYYYVLLDVELHKYTTDPYISLASGTLCRTISTCFRDTHNNKMFILCIDVACD